MRKLKENKAITLIALIITIIVLLILAGVVINMTLGNNGIIEKSQFATEQYKKNQAIEELRIKVAEINIEKRGKATLQDIVDGLNADSTNEYIVSLTPIATIKGTLPTVENSTEIYVTYKNYQFKIDSNLVVTFVGEEKTSEEEDKTYNELKITICESEENSNILKIIYAKEGELINISENITPTKDGYVLLGWKRIDESNKIAEVFNMPGHDVTIYPIWELAEDYTKLLILAGIPNPESYSEDQIYSNVDLMKIVMESEDAVNYMIKNTGNMMTKVLNNKTSASALGESILAKRKVHEDANWLAAINSSTYQYKYLTSSIVPKMDSSNLNDDGKSATKNGVTIRVSDYQNAECDVIKTVDKDLSSLWLTESASYGIHYYTIEFTDAVCVTSYYYNR